jgi:alkaline phosphatase D
MHDRRRFLTGLASAALLPTVALARVGVPRWRSDPFTLGVASGYPRPDGFVLWTRLAPVPLAPDGGVEPDAVIPVQWEVARDDGFRQVAARGQAFASAEFAHSVHVEPTGLEPGRPYWYRFRCGEATSATGRTATAPPPGSPLARLRIDTGSCQQYEHGYYAAYRQVVADPPDLFLHLGDYIYELTWGENLVRHHDAPECYTLDDYRIRHALYRLDPDLQAAHAACPWLFTWDDHEVDNDYAGDVSEELDPPAAFRRRRAAAYRAYYEHLPLPRRAVPLGSNLRLHAALSFGDLAQVVMLDGRQFRSPQACPPPGRSGGSTTICPELDEPARTMLGGAQEQWLAAQLAGSQSRWNLMGQGVVMTRVDEQPGAGERFWTDSWNGYPAARDRLLGFIGERRPANPVVLSGDVHAFGAANLRSRSADPGSPVVASEFITTSITSQGVANKLAGHIRAENPDLLFGDASWRGYLRLELTPEQLEARMVGFDSVATAGAPGRVVRTFVVESGRPGPQPA